MVKNLHFVGFPALEIPHFVGKTAVKNLHFVDVLQNHAREAMILQ